MFRILSLDGGGARGYFTISILKKIEKDYNINLSEYFDLIIGTSTGSIIASSIALDLDLEEIKDIYLKEYQNIFKKKSLFSFSSIYSKDYLQILLFKKFKNKCLKDCKTNLLITTTNIETKCPVCFKSWNNLDIKICDAILASTAVPLAFDPHKIADNMYSDGAIWANNPAIVALSEAMNVDKFNKKIDEISILSIGTGTTIAEYSFKNSNFNIFSWKDIMVSLLMQTNIKANHEMLGKILQNRYCRIDFESNNDLKMNEISKELIENIEKSYVENKENLDKFFSLDKKEVKLNFIQKLIKKLKAFLI